MLKRHWVSVGCMGAALAAVTFLLLHQYRRQQPKAAVAGAYADPASCVGCHASEAAGYASTGMAHAFYRPEAKNTVDSPGAGSSFYHQASDTYYSFLARDGKYYERRWQQGFDGKADNVEELSIDYVMGSGNHVRTYLHREQDGSLIELPVAWYAEGGGRWGMNPGYDNAHPMTRRPIAYECMFCHNAYPEIPDIAHRDLSANPVYGPNLPEGIDCQRCHGPGAAHVQAARATGNSMQAIRATILNPNKLSPDRQMEVCEQCHLETTSSLLPDRVRHMDKGPFSYSPDQWLESFNAYFARNPNYGRRDNFEIASSPYRLRQSQCYLKSQGALTCETCHDPHDLHKGPTSAAYYAGICMKCHAANLPEKIAQHQHPASNDCVSCHMPKRRTEDVIHAVMTDHLIQRRPPPQKDLLAERQEVLDTPENSYRGPVERYRLDHAVVSPDDALYDAAAQVIDGSNLKDGIPALSAAIKNLHPTQPNFSIELGDAMRHAGDLPGAIEAYRQALQLDPLSSRAQRRLGVALGNAGKTDEALSVLQTAIQREPGNALLWYEKALIEARTGDAGEAIADLHKALEVKPDFVDALNNLGSLLAQSGDSSGAEKEFRAALAVNPYDSSTRANLGRLLAGNGNLQEAVFQLGKATQLDHSNATAHLDEAVVFLQMKRNAEAEKEARAALEADKTSSRGHDLLGQIFLQKGSSAQAKGEFEAALKLDSEYAPAQLDLGETLLEEGQVQAAVPLLEKAANARVPAIAEQARGLLRQVTGGK